MNTDLWIGKAREKIQILPSGTKFVVKDLFEGVEWNQLQKGDRQSFGRLFKSEVTNPKIERKVSVHALTRQA